MNFAISHKPNKRLDTVVNCFEYRIVDYIYLSIFKGNIVLKDVVKDNHFDFLAKKSPLIYQI